jgi:PiT family inorganic phosphate transporter/sulfate permease
MGLISIIAIGACVLLAINVGGNNSAAEMGPAFGSGIRSKTEAVILIAIFSMLGAVFAGSHVVKTIGVDLIGDAPFKTDFRNVIVVLIAAASIIAFANWFHLPVATAHAMVGAVVGLGLFNGFVNWPKSFGIAIWWLVTPLASALISFLLGHFVYPGLSRKLAPISEKGGIANKVYRAFVTLSGCYMAYNAGSNSLAKAVAPIVGAGILSTNHAAILGGSCMALGAYLVGHRLMHTVGKGLTPLDPLKATMVELVCGTILFVASYAGVPVSLAETVTCSVIGFGAAHSGIREMAQNKHLRRIYVLWPVCPVYTAMVSYSGAWLIAHIP